MRSSLSIAALVLAGLCMTGCASGDSSKTAGTSEKQSLTPTKQMQAVLDTHASLNPKPLENLDPVEARKQPSPTDAVMKLKEQKGMPAAPPPGVSAVNRTLQTEKGPVKARVYTPDGGAKIKPAIIYIHGGGWVIATLDTYDASARALAKGVDAVVVSVDYRQAPEFKFPTAHEDSYNATQWVAKNASELGADPKRLAIAGESAGGNLATAVCLMAKERGGTMPVHQLLVYPITNYGFDSASYKENANAKPLNAAAMKWFFSHYLTSPADGENKLISPLRKNVDVKGLPPATIITASIDPLRSDGAEYAKKLEAAGVSVNYKNYEGVTHEFFGMADVVDEAKAAQGVAVGDLKAALK